MYYRTNVSWTVMRFYLYGIYGKNIMDDLEVLPSTCHLAGSQLVL